MGGLDKFAADEYAQSYSLGQEVQPQGFMHVAVVRVKCTGRLQKSNYVPAGMQAVTFLVFLTVSLFCVYGPWHAWHILWFDVIHVAAQGHTKV